MNLTKKQTYIFIFIFIVATIAGLYGVFNSKNYQESYIKNQISEANYCQTDSDCELVGSKCPFGCYIYVNKNEANRIKKLVDGYESRCIYSCVQSKGVECIENTCKEIIEPPSN